MKSRNEQEFRHDRDVESWHLFVTYPDDPEPELEGRVRRVLDPCVHCGRPSGLSSGLCWKCEELP